LHVSAIFFKNLQITFLEFFGVQGLAGAFWSPTQTIFRSKIIGKPQAVGDGWDSNKNRIGDKEISLMLFSSDNIVGSSTFIDLKQSTGWQ